MLSASIPLLSGSLLKFAVQAALSVTGGENAALQRLKHYLWDTDSLADYFNTRNGMLGADYSTKFSAWLAQVWLANNPAETAAVHRRALLCSLAAEACCLAHMASKALLRTVHYICLLPALPDMNHLQSALGCLHHMPDKQ